MSAQRSMQQLADFTKNLQNSDVGVEALAAVEAGTSRVSQDAAERLRAGLEQMSIDRHWRGLLLAYFDEYLGRPNPPPAEALIIDTLQSCLPFLNIICGGAFLDLSGVDIPPSLPLAMLRPDATLTLVIQDRDYAAWLKSCAVRLGLENIIVKNELAGSFEEILSRDNAPLNEVMEKAKGLLALGGRVYVLRHRANEEELNGLNSDVQFVQSIPIPVPGIDTPRQVLHLMQASAAGASNPRAAVTALLYSAGLSLDSIETEMKRIGFWTENPPDLIAAYDRGELRNYLDAPSFELWLQAVFIPRARAAIAGDTMPASSDVGGMAMRQYDYHSFVPEAQDLLQMLHGFDSLVLARSALKLSGQ